jgi:anaerobic selenocysteine-containing dehydrogenase
MGSAFVVEGGDAGRLMSEISALIDGYEGAAYDGIESGETRALTGARTGATLQAVTPPARPKQNGGLLLTTARTLYSSLEGAMIHSAEADKLHREEFIEINPADAAALRIEQNRPVVVSNGTAELTLPAALSDAVAPGSVFLPLYYDGGAVNRLIAADGALTMVTVRPV